MKKRAAPLTLLFCALTLALYFICAPVKTRILRVGKILPGQPQIALIR